MGRTRDGRPSGSENLESIGEINKISHRLRREGLDTSAIRGAISEFFPLVVNNINTIIDEHSQDGSVNAICSQKMDWFCSPYLFK